MATYKNRDYPTLCPYIYCEDGTAMFDWLRLVFGFTERMRSDRTDGKLGHAELALDGAVVMLAHVEGHKSPRTTGLKPGGLYVHVDDVDAHYVHAKDQGAEVEGEPADQEYGVRGYGVVDLEGNQWWFSTPLTPGRSVATRDYDL
jgi:uncharacterized glyoxalase superfamily protein PhnB